MVEASQVEGSMKGGGTTPGARMDAIPERFVKQLVAKAADLLPTRGVASQSEPIR